MAYIYAGPGSDDKVTLKIQVASDGTNDELSVPALNDVTVDISNDVFSFSSLEDDTVTQVATVASNSISGNIVLDSLKFFGTAIGSYGSSTTASSFGIFGLSKNKVRIEFTLEMGIDETNNAAGGSLGDLPKISGTGYITGLSPNISADSPVWVSSFTIVGDTSPTATVVAKT